ncbi:hypothetical protein Sipo8835_32605 [Streptomyces ipomoeae]|uniref:Uncharacterized protein n=1 Tax=Streptomyces ipomoeae TaxID=103232 RepID=A0AAE9AXF7_9ACTN|nr:hypothetical protein [Streptomyces ipomoeae]TQE24856.1 hypothetical protein Sipo8835_32605 [Streptomyces ipomoeae]
MATNDDELDREAEKVYNLWKQGVNRKAIGRRYGMSLDVVNRRLSRARKNLGEDALADMRTDTESSLDDLIRASHRNLKSAETVMERNSIIRTIADLKMRKAKLLGLEVPAKVTLEMEKAVELLHFQDESGWRD